MERWLYHAGAFAIGAKIDRPIFNAVKQSEPDLIWVDQGAYLGGGLIAKCRTLSVPIVNYTIDDPFGGRDGRRFDRYFEALPFYDLLAVVREENIADAYARGARNVQRIWRSADEVAHRPRLLTEEDRQRWGSEVCFAAQSRGTRIAAIANIRSDMPILSASRGPSRRSADLVPLESRRFCRREAHAARSPFSWPPEWR